MKKFVLLALYLIIGLSVFSQPLSPQVVSITMRDDKLLAADVYIPQPQTAKPTILIQTPYNKNLYRWGLPLGFAQDVNSSPYNFVIVDWRGFYGSAAAFVAQYDRGLDGYDCIDWIVQQEWSNGEVGTWGPSALGKIQFLTAKQQHPAHVCAVPLVASPEYLYSEYYPGGVYREEYVEQLDALGYGMSTVLTAHPYFDFVWQYAQNQNDYPEMISIPCLMISGWFDHDANMKTNYYNTLRNEAVPAVRDEQWLVMGPWVHGGHGSANVGNSQQGELLFPEAAGFETEMAIAFFGYYLLDWDNNWPSTPFVQYFQMGDNEWKTRENWPPTDETDAVKYYLTNTGSLRTNVSLPPSSATSFIYDPRDPSPTIGGSTLRNDLLQGPYDQSDLVESRNDIAIFTTSALTQPVVVKGRPKLKLFVSSDCLDTDVAVRLTDVYPDGSSELMLDGIYRMRFSGGFSTADTSFMQAGEIYEIEIELYDIAITFQAGHSIRLDVTGSNWPRFQRNKNTVGEPFEAGDTLISNTMIYHQAQNASYLELPVVLSNLVFSANNQQSFELYPNPVSEVLNFKNEFRVENFTISIINIQGQVLMTQKNANCMDLSNLEPGLYFAEFRSENFRLIKQFSKL